MMRRSLGLVVIGLVAIACSSTATQSGDTSGADGGDSEGGAGANDGGVPTDKDSGGPVGGGGMSGPADPVDLGKGMPQVLLGSKGATAVLVSPKVTALTYDNDTNRAEIEAFLPAFAKSVAWSSTTKEYGVSALTVSAPIHLTGNAPTSMTDTQAKAVLKAQAPLDASTIYTLFLPKGTLIDDGTGAKCCTDYDGYHGNYTTGGVTAPYAIVCACPGFDGKAITDLQQITVAAAHETVEAATDPFDKTPGYSQPDNAHIAWSLVTGGETADMCALADSAYWIPSDMKYMVQRSWSNAAASAGHDPCTGDPTTPYYTTIPTLSDTVTLSDYAVTTSSIKIAKGATGTLKLKVYADTSTAGEFNVQIDDFAGSGYITAKNPTATFKSGDELAIDITVVNADPNYAVAGGGAEIFQITTTPSNGKGPSVYYWGLVSQ